MIHTKVFKLNVRSIENNEYKSDIQILNNLAHKRFLSRTHNDDEIDNYVNKVNNYQTKNKINNNKNNKKYDNKNKKKNNYVNNEKKLTLNDDAIEKYNKNKHINIYKYGICRKRVDSIYNGSSHIERQNNCTRMWKQRSRFRNYILDKKYKENNLIIK